MKYPFLMLAFAAVFFTSCNDDNTPDTRQPASAIEDASVELVNGQSLDTLVNDIGEAKFVLLGEASHGTAEFYEWRATITERLVEEKGFNIVAVEGDWPDLYRLNEYILGSNTHGGDARSVLSNIDRWPTWMWANEEVATFAEWLRAYNAANSNRPVSFYGMDVYSLWDSMEEALQYFEDTDADAAARAQQALTCFAPYKSRDEWAYAQAKQGQQTDCADELQSLLSAAQEHAQANNNDAAFNALQNAYIAVNAERYYVTALQSNAESWNVRDRHMTETINRLVTHHGDDAKVVVWAHNTHVGDARATSMENEGMVNLGQLMREQYNNAQVYVVGFGTYTGKVIASNAWGSAVREMQVPEAVGGSWEALLHDKGPSQKIIFMDKLQSSTGFKEPMGHRAIGVVYDPSNERGNYVTSVLPERYDAFIFIDETSALHPLTSPAGRKRKLPDQAMHQFTID